MPYTMITYINGCHRAVQIAGRWTVNLHSSRNAHKAEKTFELFRCFLTKRWTVLCICALLKLELELVESEE
jgi:hypothetical protein